MYFSTAHKVALMVAAPTMCVFLYLLLWYREKDDEAEEPTKETVATSRQTVIEVKVPRHAVGGVIGSGGENIKRIQENSGARVNFKDDMERESDTERTVLIRGTQESAQKAELLVLKAVADQPPIVTDSITVQQRYLGRIIGKGGVNIREMCRISRCKIKVAQSARDVKSDSPVLVNLRGTTQGIERAKDLIKEKINEEDESRAKITQSVASRPERHHSRHDNPAVVNGHSHAQGDVRGKEPELMHCDGDRLDLDMWPKHKDFFEVYICAVDTPSHFWVQRVSSQSAELDLLTSKMTAFYSNPKFSTAMPAEDVKVGDIIAAPFSFDDQWYRARVVDVMEEQYDLYYVDFGDSGYIKKDQAMSLGGDFSGLPFQAFECFLAKVKPKDGAWSEEATREFESLSHLAKWKVVMARTVSYSQVDNTSIPCIELVDTSGKDDVNIGEELVGRGYGEWEDTPKEGAANQS